jgi:hypothetical protein
MRVKNPAQVNATGSHSTVLLRQVIHPILRAAPLVGILVNGHFKEPDAESRGRTESGRDGRIDSTAHSHNKSLYPCLVGIGTKPLNNVLG